MLSLFLLTAFAVMMIVTPKELAKGREIWGYARVSSNSQKSALETQKKTLQTFAKKEMNSKIARGRLYAEMKSGSSLKGRKELKKLSNDVLKHIAKGGKPPVILLKGAARWSRKPREAWKMLGPLQDLGVNLYSIIQAQYTESRKFPNYQGESMMGIMWNLGRIEVGTNQQRLAKARDEAMKDFRHIGGRFNFFRDGKRIDWYKMITETWPQWKRGEISMNAAGKKYGMSDTAMRKNFQREYKFEGKILPQGRFDFINEKLEFEGEDAEGNPADGSRTLDEWVDVVRRVGQVAEKYGEDSLEFNAVRTMSSGYLVRPWLMPPAESESSVVNKASFKLYLTEPQNWISPYLRELKKKGKK